MPTQAEENAVPVPVAAGTTQEPETALTAPLWVETAYPAQLVLVVSVEGTRRSSSRSTCNRALLPCGTFMDVPPSKMRVRDVRSLANRRLGGRMATAFL